jgi:hypothetical protein
MRLAGGVGLVLLAVAALAPVPGPTATLLAAAPPPAMAIVPSCGAPAPAGEEFPTPYSIRVFGIHLGPYGVTIVFNPGPTEQDFPARPNSDGILNTVVSVRPPTVAATYTVEIQDLDQVPMARAQFQVPCPAPPPSPSPTARPPGSPPPGSPGGPASPSPSAPVRGTPAPVLNPTLTITPAVGPPGTVVVARGADFPVSVPVHLAWSQGIAGASAPVTTDGTGAFTTTVLVLPHDELGTRVLTAVSAAPPGSSLFGFADAAFLVVAGEAQPSDFAGRR